MLSSQAAQSGCQSDTRSEPIRSDGRRGRGETYGGTPRPRRSFRADRGGEGVTQASPPGPSPPKRHPRAPKAAWARVQYNPQRSWAQQNPVTCDRMQRHAVTGTKRGPLPSHPVTAITLLACRDFGHGDREGPPRARGENKLPSSRRLPRDGGGASAMVGQCSGLTCTLLFRIMQPLRANGRD